MMRVFGLSLLCALFAASLAGCGGSDKAIPAAPSGLTVEMLSGGAHLTWTDNSTDEDQFMIERMVDSGKYMTLTSVPFNTTSYHDAPLTSGHMYMYHVMSMNSAGMSASSNEVMLQVP